MGWSLQPYVSIVSARASYKVNVNWAKCMAKCSVTVFREHDAGELAAEKARLKEATAQRASAPRKQAKAKSIRLATKAREQSQPIYMSVQGQGVYKGK